MKIFINGETRALQHTEKLATVLPNTETGKPFAVAINGEFVARSEYTTRELQDGDEIDIVSPVGGG